MNKKLKTGIIGAGGICEGIHLPSLNDIESCDPVWICDVIESRAERLADTWCIPKHGSNYKTLLETDKPDAVFVLVQPDQAFRIALDCMESGCHVFMEKPMGITSYQADTLVRTAKENNVQCQIGFNRRFIPLVRTVVNKMKRLGDIYQIDGFFFKNSDADFYSGCSSAFTCDVIHTVDVIRSIAASEASSAVQLAARYGDSRVDNAWNALIAFENGITATVRSNYATGGRVHGITLHGNCASAYINLGFGSEAGSARILYSGAKSFSRASVGVPDQDTEVIDIMQAAGSDAYYRYYGYYEEDLQFVEAVLKGTAVPCGAEDAAKTMHLLDLMKAGEKTVGCRGKHI